MEIYFFITSLFLISGYLLYQNKILKDKIDQNDAKRNKEFSDAGRAITDALRTAFENIKTVNQKQERLSRNLKDLDTRLQSIMFHDKRMNRNKIKIIEKDKTTPHNNEE